MSDSMTDVRGKASLQHVVPATLVLVLAVTVAWLSYTREPSDAYLFPRLISTVMLLLAVWNFCRAFLGLARVGEGLSMNTVRHIAPGLLVLSVFVYVAAKLLGFYVASFAAFLCLYSVYDPAPHTAMASWTKRLVVNRCFYVELYMVYSRCY